MVSPIKKKGHKTVICFIFERITWVWQRVDRRSVYPTGFESRQSVSCVDRTRNFQRFLLGSTWLYSRNSVESLDSLLLLLSTNRLSHRTVEELVRVLLDFTIYNSTGCKNIWHKVNIFCVLSNVPVFVSRINTMKRIFKIL